MRHFLAEVVTHAFYTVCAVIILLWVVMKIAGAL